ncbi:response regulator transcription factor [Thermosynechococcaceae cyanobacterium BACA0444]|uniref:Response regulator transcription factor n=1 Tax=Pseudocalidococcus azoricus BACA0444 TaxID=2918990 RepID=A0AAE4JYF2_9CYAN|nr:response regulator transcription factor [Pseudocalidococcus azoricus]MDS3859632.1 response regulator transcription factor [Pseudocalidococcus azoricus BACA0444]
MDSSPGLACKTLLLVDDDPNLVLLVQDYLELKGYRVLTAAQGREALQVLKHETPDMIICDVMMPEMDGYHFVRHVREQENIKWLPVLFLSAKGQTEDRVMGLNTGADVYMVKPFEPEELVAQIEASLKQSERVKQLQAANLEVPGPLPLPEGIELTPTETKVLRLVAQGLANKDIANQLVVSQRTVESHVSNMLGKTGLTNRTELARWALDYRLS